jgi:hypothetical protein
MLFETALLIQAHLLWVVVAMVALFLYGVTFSKWGVMFLVGFTSYIAMGIYAYYLV